MITHRTQPRDNVARKLTVLLLGRTVLVRESSRRFDSGVSKGLIKDRLDTGYGGALLQRYLPLVTYMGNGGFLCGLWANGIDRELKGGGEGRGWKWIYIHIYTEC